jgi:hypothetical protein
MSLHHLQTAGRNGDSMLVHMTPGEVSGLQALAKAHGGSLTINPETGLPEAFFLASLLPTILGAGAAATGMSALNAALLTGAIGTAVTGDLGQGIMMGLGAYGGAGLGGALSKMGTAATAAPAANVASAGVEGLKQGIFGGTPKIFNPATTAATAATPAATAAATPGALDLTGMMSKAGMPTGAYPVTASMPAQTPMFDITSSVNAGGSAMAPDRFADLRAPANVPQSTIDKLAAGAKKATSGMDGLKELYKTSEEFAPGSSMASLASTMYNMQADGKPARRDESLIRPYRFHRTYTPEGGGDTGYGTSERRYFDDRFEALDPYAAPGPEYAASGGLMGIRRYADGGYTRYTGTTPLDPKKDDFYYVPGSMGGGGYYMVREGTQGGAGGAGGSTGPYKYDYDPATGKFTQLSGPGMDTGTPKLSTDPRSYSAETLNPLYQQYFGRDVDPEGVAAYTAKQFSPAQLDEIFKASPEYGRRQERVAAEKKEASYVTPTQAANLYQDLMGRTIDPVGLKYYTQEKRMTPAELKKELMGSEEYLTKLTKPLAPRPFTTHTGAIGLEGAMRTPEQEAARTRPSADFYAMMDRELKAQAKKQGAEYAVGGPVEQMSAMNAIGDNTMYPQSQYQTPMYSNPMGQRPMPTNVIPQGLDALVNRYSGEQRMAAGGLSSLGGYSDGGRLLRGPGDGVSDSIPAVIGKRQPARLADGEFVVPARIVSEIGNGSTEAGARKLYAMMDRVQKARGKTVGKGKVAKNTKAEKYLPA